MISLTTDCHSTIHFALESKDLWIPLIGDSMRFAVKMQYAQREYHEDVKMLEEIERITADEPVSGRGTLAWSGLDHDSVKRLLDFAADNKCRMVKLEINYTGQESIRRRIDESTA